MADRRVVFDFAITFANGGGLQGQGFRLDVVGADIADDALAAHIVDALQLRMVDGVDILSKQYIDEPHERRATATTSGTRLIDLSHPIVGDMTTYPGLPGPGITTHLSRGDSRSHYAEGVEFHIGRIDMVGNTGTYIDTPFHRYADGYDTAGLPLDKVVGVPGVVVDAAGRMIGPGTFDGIGTRGHAVLIRTGWDGRFGQADYLGEHPHLTEAAARRLIDGGAVLVGIDSANIDATDGGERPAHSLLLEHGIPIVEHLTGLDRLPEGDVFDLFAIPAPVVGMGSLPVRVVARVIDRVG